MGRVGEREQRHSSLKGNGLNYACTPVSAGFVGVGFGLVGKLGIN